MRPRFDETAFECPTCTAYAQMLWCMLKPKYTNLELDAPCNYNLFAAICQAKQCISLWIQSSIQSPYQEHPNPVEMVYPRHKLREPSADMPPSARALYIEAAKIVSDSPRGAAALLRMCTEDVAKALTPKLGRNKTLNQRIGYLVKEHNLPDRVQQALDVLRIAGDNAVHSPTINLGDDTETATALFDLVDVIVAETLSPQEATNRFYANLPESKLDQIRERDAREP